MNRLLLLLDNTRNRDLLTDWLGQRYNIMHPAEDAWFQAPFDVCLIDGPTLERLGAAVQARKVEEGSVFLPFVLMTTRRETELITRHLWRTVDDIIRMPIEKLELQARIEVLLRSRRLSMDLRMRNEELESFFHAMSHDVRAPLRAVQGFVQLLQAEEAERLSPQGRHDLGQIQAVVRHMQDTINGLVEFARIEYGNRQLQPISLDLLVRRCVAQMEREIEQRQARVVINGPLPQAQGNAALLTSAVTNLLSNALKFVEPGKQPCVTIRANVAHQICRLEIEDNGIGIALENQERLFRPFSQLHGGEVYEGVGLGLATVRKAMELMGGRSGVTSSPGRGSVFWLEMGVASEADRGVAGDANPDH
ncbi:MAG TPA: HAMP domain-containing sensor histidine kinase [Ktedonobacterales bacterium]|nr:HAMP domain-containing sensor histidine kinase [Ktedonobacterales bacterium]